MEDGSTKPPVIPVVPEELGPVGAGSEQPQPGSLPGPGDQQPGPDQPPPPGTDEPPVSLEELVERDMICIQLGVPYTGKDSIDSLIAEANTREIATAAMSTILNSNVLMERIKRDAANKNVPEKTIVCKMAVEYAEELMLHLYRPKADPT